MNSGRMAAGNDHDWSSGVTLSSSALTRHSLSPLLAKLARSILSRSISVYSQVYKSDRIGLARTQAKYHSPLYVILYKGSLSQKAFAATKAYDVLHGSYVGIELVLFA